MKTYHYRPESIGLTDFPLGELRLKGEEVSPDQAEVFVMPCTIKHLSREQVYGLPYLRGNEGRHCFLNVSEDIDKWYDLPCLFIRCDATQRMREHDPNTIAWPWPVRPYYVPFERFDYDVVFQGWNSTPLTERVVKSVERTKLKSHLKMNNFFFGYHDGKPEYKHYEDSYRDTLLHSRLSLVPRSIVGVIRYRFYEAMSAGHVTVHLCDNVMLPLSDQIDYGKCSIHIPEADVDNAGEILTAWLSKHTDEQIIEMGEYAHQMWDRYLDGRKSNEVLTEVVTNYYRHAEVS